MSLFPYAFREMIRPLRMLENHLRQSEEIFNHFAYPLSRMMPVEHPGEYSSVIDDKEKFQVKINVHDFKPDNIKVRMLEGNAIQVEAKMEEKREDGGTLSKQMIRKFVLPEGHDLKSTISKLSSDGVLTITAPKAAVPEIEEKTIPITFENEPGTEKSNK